MASALVLIAVFALAVWLTGRWRQFAVRRELLDHPNARSSHHVATPHGGGIAIVTAALAGLLMLAAMGRVPWSFVGALWTGGTIAALIGLFDDRRPVAEHWRLAGHFLSAACVLVWLGGLPPLPWFGTVVSLGWIGDGLALVSLVWLLNLTNFMDGIDGIAGVEVVTVTTMGAILAAGLTSGNWAAPLAVAAATLGFLVWNWPPAKIFMGDVGSGFLGLALGALLLQAAWVDGRLFWSWLVLMAVFETDATVTLVRRVARGVPRFWRAHRSHAYQRLTTQWGAHRPVTIAVGAINVGWLFPVASLVALGWLDGPTGLIVACVPLAVVAYRLGAGAAETTEPS